MDATASARTVTLTGLTNGTSYTFVVKAKNSVGSSVASAASNAVTPRSGVPTPRAPAAPTGVSATAGDAIAAVTWTAPTDTGTVAISGYTVTSSPGNISVNAAASAKSATVTGLTNGTKYTFVVLAKNSVGSSPASVASNAVTPVSTTPLPPPPPTSSWTRLGPAGSLYTFTGYHVARWTTSDTSKSLKTMAYHELPCGLTGFGNKQPGGTGSSWCDVGPSLYDTLIVPMAMGPLTRSTVVAPMGSPGSGTRDVTSGGGGGVHTDGSGSFRTTCSLAKFLFDDPIVFPGQPGKSHLHMFFGNTAVDNTMTSDLITTKGNSSCRGGILNRTGYWTPAMIDANGNVVMPDEATVYYKTGYNVDPTVIQPMPTGLKMIAGDSKATAAQWAGPQQIITWMCLNGSGGGGNTTIPNCGAGDAVRLTVIFPQCWDGKNLDSPDHKSHMAYPIYSSGARSQCPADHPITVPEVTEHFDWPVPSGVSSSTWRLSSDMDTSKPGGLSAHADWMMGWDVATMKSLVTLCLNKALDCGVGGIGSGSLF